MTPQRHLPGKLSRGEIIKLFGISTSVALAPPLLAECAVDPVTDQQQLMMKSPAEEIS